MDAELDLWGQYHGHSVITIFGLRRLCLPTNVSKEGYALLLETTDSFFDSKTKIKALLQSRVEQKKELNTAPSSD